MSNSVEPRFSDADLATCLKVLQALGDRPGLCTADEAKYADVVDQAGRLRHVVKQQRKEEMRERDRKTLRQVADARAGTRAQQELVCDLAVPRRCYVCRREFTRVHFFYDMHCPTCAEMHYAKRTQSADLAGRVALVTGGRVKIGFHVVLKLLRAGATVISTTRFPRDAARRFAAEADFDEWAPRLQIHGIDLRHLPAVEQFAGFLGDTLERLDIIINNAAQTVRRPPAFYQHLLAGEMEELPSRAHHLVGFVEPPSSVMAVPAIGSAPAEAIAASLSQLALLPGDDGRDEVHFPLGEYDADGQQRDRRPVNSWALRLRDVSLCELLETHAVNCFAPFLLLSRLEPLLFRSAVRDRFVVNVSAMEGQLNCVYKTGHHPHTNMAKAGLNMLTRTCSEQYARKRVFMNSVDTGWITNEWPYPQAQAMEADGFRPPLDVVDGAARICHPIFTGVASSRPIFGKLFKNYQEVPW